MSLYPIRTLAVVIGLLGSLAAPSITHGTGLDLNANGMSDVWEIVFGASALTPNADTDGDGFTNAEESLAGTDPFNAASHPSLSIAPWANDSVRIAFDAVAGKRYQFQSRTHLTQDVWQSELNTLATSTSPSSEQLPRSPPRRNFSGCG